MAYRAAGVALLVSLLSQCMGIAEAKSGAHSAHHAYTIATHRTSAKGAAHRGHYNGPGLYEIGGQLVHIYGAD